MALCSINVTDRFMTEFLGQHLLHQHGTKNEGKEYHSDPRGKMGLRSDPWRVYPFDYPANRVAAYCILLCESAILLGRIASN